MARRGCVDGKQKKMMVDSRTRGGVGGYDRGNAKYNGANQGWKRLRYIYIDYQPMYGAYKSNGGSRAGTGKYERANPKYTGARYILRRLLAHVRGLRKNLVKMTCRLWESDMMVNQCLLKGHYA